MKVTTILIATAALIGGAMIANAQVITPPSANSTRHPPGGGTGDKVGETEGTKSWKPGDRTPPPEQAVESKQGEEQNTSTPGKPR
jgi:hypothetical protein